jgi:arylsulfatase A-like enzyme
MLIMRGPSAFSGGKVIDQPVTHLDVYPTLCEVAGVEPPDWLQGESLVPLLRGETDVVHEATFAEMTYHAAYEPQRSVRTERWKYIRRFDDFPGPVLANCDDSASKEIWLEAGWGERTVPREQLYDLVLDPAEMENRADDPGAAAALAEMRRRLDEWMRDTDDPLLDGPVYPPVGAEVNEPWQVSPDEPTRTVTGDPTGAPSS